MENNVKYLKTKEELTEHTNSNFVLDFTASWCGPCKSIAPHFENLAKEEAYKHISFYKVDVNESEELCKEYKVSAMPTFIFLKNKKQIDVVTGANLNKLKEKLQEHFRRK